MTRTALLSCLFVPFTTTFLPAISLLALIPHSFAQQTPLQITSFSVSPDQTLTYPNSSSGANQLAGFADDHSTFFPPAASGAPYLVFGGAEAGVGSNTWGAVVLQTTDLMTFDFAPGYTFPVLKSPNHFTVCNPADDTEFDENYAAPGSVLQDPTLPAGNLIMIYHAENIAQGECGNLLSTLPSALPGHRTMG
jgi:hypothetical protein